MPNFPQQGFLQSPLQQQATPSLEQQAVGGDNKQQISNFMTALNGVGAGGNNAQMNQGQQPMTQTPAGLIPGAPGPPNPQLSFTPGMQTPGTFAPGMQSIGSFAPGGQTQPSFNPGMQTQGMAPGQIQNPADPQFSPINNGSTAPGSYSAANPVNQNTVDWGNQAGFTQMYPQQQAAPPTFQLPAMQLLDAGVPNTVTPANLQSGTAPPEQQPAAPLPPAMTQPAASGYVNVGTPGNPQYMAIGDYQRQQQQQALNASGALNTTGQSAPAAQPAPAYQPPPATSHAPLPATQQGPVGIGGPNTVGGQSPFTPASPLAPPQSPVDYGGVNPVLQQQYAGQQVERSPYAMSDVTRKQDITPAQSKLVDFMQKIGAHNYTYKDPIDGQGVFTSPMAQELEATDLGKQAVIETPRGKMVDYARLGGVNLAAVSVVYKEQEKMKTQLAALQRRVNGR